MSAYSDHLMEKEYKLCQYYNTTKAVMKIKCTGVLTFASHCCLMTTISPRSCAPKLRKTVQFSAHIYNIMQWVLDTLFGFRSRNQLKKEHFILQYQSEKSEIRFAWFSLDSDTTAS